MELLVLFLGALTPTSLILWVCRTHAPRVALEEATPRPPSLESRVEAAGVELLGELQRETGLGQGLSGRRRFEPGFGPHGGSPLLPLGLAFSV
jgi:hypothetical protein